MSDPVGAGVLRHLLTVLKAVAGLGVLALIADRLMGRTLLTGRIGAAIVAMALVSAGGGCWIARSLEHSYRARALERVAGSADDFSLRVGGRETPGGPAFVQLLREMSDESFARSSSFGDPIDIELAGHGNVLNLKMQRELRHPLQYRVCVTVSNSSAGCDQAIGMVVTSLLNGYGT